MYASVYDLKAFYNSKIGRIVRRVICERIKQFWPDKQGLRVMGYGYASPYLRILEQDAERLFGIMPAGQGAHQWPQRSGDLNLIALSEETEIPIETNSVDRILMIHSLEFSEFSRENLREMYRVLKSNGRMLVIVPNRNGLWARWDWSPFGQGTPYSISQLTSYLKEKMFVHERTQEALFMPPFKSSWMMKSAGMFEYIGQNYCSIGSGLHMVEVSKQLYARSDSSGGSKVRVRGRGVFGVRRPATLGVRIDHSSRR